MESSVNYTNFIYIYICTYIHTYMHACIHTNIHTCIHTYIHIYTHKHTYIHTYTHTYLHTYIHGSGESSVGIASRYGLDVPGNESRWRPDNPHPSRPALRPTQPPIQWVPGLSRE